MPRGRASGSDFATAASRYIGTPYAWGGDRPGGFDCSGLVEYVLTRMGLRGVPRTSEQQYRWTNRVKPAQLQAGDLVFLNFPGEVSPGHVMIYSGSNRVIQAPGTGQRVRSSYFSPLDPGSHEWGGKIVGYGRVPGLDYSNEPLGGGASVSLEQLWTEADGPKNVARIMAAIALAESGGRTDARHTNSDGSVDYGLWQINSVHGYDPGRLTSDPHYNARAAVSVYHSQGLKAWTTYTSGRYRRFLPQADQATLPDGFKGRTRPPADASSSSSGGGGQDQAAAAAEAASSAQQDLWASYISDADAQPGPSVQPAAFDWRHPWTEVPLPSIPDPFNLFGDAASAVSDAGTFLKWVAWIFSPRNLLRIVEFAAGAGLMAAGLMFARESFKGDGGGSSPGPSNVRRATIRRVVRSTPPGRTLALAQAGQQGRQRARKARGAEVAKRHRTEEKRARDVAQRREAARRGPGESRRAARQRRSSEREEIPF